MAIYYFFRKIITTGLELYPIIIVELQFWTFVASDLRTIIEIVQQQSKRYFMKLLRYDYFECNFKKCLALLHCRAMALKLALKPICMKPYLTFWAFSDFSRTQMDYVTSKSLVNQRCKIAEKYLAKLKYVFQKSEKKDANREICFKFRTRV